MVSQLEFYKIARKSALSINSQAKSFPEDQSDRLLYFMKNPVWVPRHEFWLNLHYRPQWPKTTLNCIIHYTYQYITTCSPVWGCRRGWCMFSCQKLQWLINQIYDVPMKFVHKLVHWGPVHPCYEPLHVLQQCIRYPHTCITKAA